MTREFRELILRAYKAQSLPEAAANFFHGACNGRLVVIGPINLPVGRLFVEETITECRKCSASRVDLLAFEFEMGLFSAVLEEARGKGIELTPKQIPPEVFDKRAVERGLVAPSQGELVEWEDGWTGGDIFENEWQSSRTRHDRALELQSVVHTCARRGRYQVAVKVIDIFGNDTMTIVPVSVG